MAKINAANERIKRQYFQYQKGARGRDEATIDRVAKSLARFEETNGGKDFKRFHREQALAFKRKLADDRNARTGHQLSKATVHSTLRDLKVFFEWLWHRPGFKSRFEFMDADYFNLSGKDTAIARTRREKPIPTLQQVEHVLASMPANTALERRDRALIALATLTGARGNALASLQLGHYIAAERLIDQDARTVRTKFAKTICTYLMPVSDAALAIFEAWVNELRNLHLWADSDPLFPSTEMCTGDGGGFQPKGLARRGWASTDAIRTIYRKAFGGAGLPYYNPHTFRNMLVRHAMSLGLTPEALKAWSQNLGHADVLTTLTSYGEVPVQRQGELIRAAGHRAARDPLDDPDIIELIDKITRKRA